jgi:hypothetical protein
LLGLFIILNQPAKDVLSAICIPSYLSKGEHTLYCTVHTILLLKNYSRKTTTR